MSDRQRENPADGFQDLVPWADPYIAALIEKLRRAVEFDSDFTLDGEATGELPPPLDSQDADRDDGWPGEWTPRNWPRD